MSSRTWLECFIPRDLTMLSARFRSPACLADVREVNPGVRNRRDLHGRLLRQRLSALQQAGGEQRDAFGFGEADQTLCNPPRGERRTCFGDGRKGVNDHAAGLMLTNDTLDVHQVDFRAEGLSAPNASSTRRSSNAGQGECPPTKGRARLRTDFRQS